MADIPYQLKLKMYLVVFACSKLDCKKVIIITGYDRKSHQTFTIEDDLDVNRTDYDGKDRTIRTLDSHVSNGFDPANGRFDPSNLLGNAVLQAYDDNDNVIKTREFDVLDLDNDGTADAFDANGDGTVDGNDQTLDVDLDGTKEVHAEVFRTTMLYDSLDRVQTRFDNRGQTHDMRYDSRNNQVSQADAQGPTGTGRTFDRRWTNPFDGSTDT
jgi:YD repeat-containing protein